MQLASRGACGPSRKIVPMDGSEVLDGLSAEVIARITGVDITTARR
jgi:hypothetical protein